jgi:hypothetical protein
MTLATEDEADALVATVAASVWGVKTRSRS